MNPLPNPAPRSEIISDSLFLDSDGVLDTSRRTTEGDEVC
jgi:hypothetical protein